MSEAGRVVVGVDVGRMPDMTAISLLKIDPAAFKGVASSAKIAEIQWSSYSAACHAIAQQMRKLAEQVIRHNLAVILGVDEPAPVDPLRQELEEWRQEVRMLRLRVEDEDGVYEQRHRRASIARGVRESARVFMLDTNRHYHRQALAPRPAIRRIARSSTWV